MQIAITTWGSDFYFAIMSVMGAVSLTILGLSAMKPRSHRVFFYLSAGLCMVACIAYFAMGSNLGWTPIDVEFLDNGGGIGRNREIFYARYIDWFITTPMLLLDLCLTAGLPWPTILWVIAMDEAMVVTGLIGALVKSRYKWGFYVFGCVAMVSYPHVRGRSKLTAGRLESSTNSPSSAVQMPPSWVVTCTEFSCYAVS